LSCLLLDRSVDARDRVQHDLRDVVPELLGEVETETLALVAREDRADLGDHARGGQSAEVEICEPSRDLLALECEAGEGAGRVVGENARLAETLRDLDRITVDEQKAAARREADE